MSAYSTMRITRGKAKRMVIDYIMEYGCNDAMLVDFANEILRDRLYNVVIVPDGADNDEGQL